MKIVPDKSCRENQKKDVNFIKFPKTVRFRIKCGKIFCSWTGHRLDYGACAMRAEYLRLQTHTHDM
jgi:hypothetical protein